MRKINCNPSSAITLVLIIFIVLFISPVLAQEGRPTEALQPKIEATPSISPQESEERLNDAKELFDRGKTDAAIFLLQQLQKADPTNYKVLFKLGEMAIADHNWAYSISVLRKASFIRPKDIEVRLILMDIYKAYQMPIQSVVVAKEILALDPSHVLGTKRLADLYQEQAMLEDEISTRKRLRQLTPKDYDNLKRMAVVYNKSGDLWEAAKVYEQIRQYYPKNNQDLSKLAGIYNRLGEYFHLLEIVDQLNENGQSRRWLEKRAVDNLRKQTELYDPFYTVFTIQNDKSDELKSTSLSTSARYSYLSIRSSLEFGGTLKLARANHKGLKDLDGEFHIDRSEFVFDTRKSWHGQDYQLIASLGAINDKINGKLFLNSSSGSNAGDFPLLKDPSFESYGGTMGIGSLKFLVQPGVVNHYQIAYERGQVDELDARLQMLSFDKVSFDYSYESDDLTSVQAVVDFAEISDDNSRTHALASGNYVLSGSAPMRDYKGGRHGFFRSPLAQSISLGYTIEYFDDKKQSNLYQIYNSEIRHKGMLSGQYKIAKIGTNTPVYLKLGYEYSTGTTLDSQHNVRARVFYNNGDSGNEIGITLGYEKSVVDDSTQQNQRIIGESKSFILFVDANLRF